MKSSEEFEIETHLKEFSHIAKNSKEFQGHGWGIAYLKNNEWQHYRNIKPIWEDSINKFGKTTLLLAHARSAFQDKDIVIDNNMPFYDDKYIFVFNGELRGVKIKESGRTGAEKIFNFIKRFDKNNMENAVSEGVTQIKKKTEYIRALNFIIATKDHVYLNTFYSEDLEYFSMHMKESKNEIIICSQAYINNEGWETIPNDTIRSW